MYYMKIKHQLSIATLVMAGVFTTGCSQQSVMGEGARTPDPVPHIWLQKQKYEHEIWQN